MESAREWIQRASDGLENLAVVIMVLFILVATTAALYQYFKRTAGAYRTYRIALARTLQVGLELLVAADIIRTVSTPLTETNLALLCGLVLVRTFLGWSLAVEIEGHWPWQQAKESALQPETEKRPIAVEDHAAA